MRRHAFRTKYIYILHIIILNCTTCGSNEVIYIGTFNYTLCDFRELFRYIMYDIEPEKRMRYLVFKFKNCSLPI